MLTLEVLFKKASLYIKEVQNLFSMDLAELREKALEVARKCELSFFAPIYVSSICQSTCGYCAFRKGSKIKRRTLTLEEVRQEVAFLKSQGYSTVYCLSGSFPEGSLTKRGSMTEVNARGIRVIREAGLFTVLESSPFSLENFTALLSMAEGEARFVLFQECYDRNTYLDIHGGDIYKGDPDARLQQLDLALASGWPEVGIGVLIGLHYDVASEVACLIAHFDYLESLGARKVTISVPRINDADGIEIKEKSSREMFLKTNYIIKILRPNAPIVLTGRESEEVRDLLRPVTDIWGVKGSTVPGGYTLNGNPENGQFMLYDRRSITELNFTG